jgi:hypothetical protein
VENYAKDRQATDGNMAHAHSMLYKTKNVHSKYVILILLHHKNGYANAPRHVTPTSSLSKHTNNRRSLDRPRQSMYILHSDQFAGHYCNTVQHCEGLRSVVIAVQLVGRKLIGLN